MRLRIGIEGMSCSHCVSHVKKALDGLPGVSGVEVSLADKVAYLDVDEQLKYETLKDVIEDAGYELVTVSEN